MNYQELINRIELGETFNYLLFYGHHQKKEGIIDISCLSQWYEINFEVNGIIYKSAEHYMMAQKAKLFNDENSFNEIINSSTPKQAKELGRLVQNFSNEICIHC